MGRYLSIIFFLILNTVSVYGSTSKQDLSKTFLNSLINRQEYQKVLQYINKEKDFLYLKGICYLNLMDYKNALFYFIQSKNKDKTIDSKKLNFYIGLCYYKMQDFQNAISYLKSAEKSEKTFFFLGLSHYYIGNYSKALKYFNLITSQLKNEADYFKAITVLKLNKKDIALKILKKILNNNPEPYLRNQINNKINSYNKSKFNINLYTSLSYDSNVLREPESSSSESSNKDDFYNEIFFDINKKFFITEELNIQPEFNFYKSTYQNLNKYNLKGFSLGPNLSFMNDKFFFHLKPYYESFELDGKNYQKNYILLSEVFFNNFKDNYLNLKILTGKKNFYKYGFKDCDFVEFNINQYIEFHNNYYRIGLKLRNEDSDAKLYSFRSLGFSEGFAIQILDSLKLQNDIFFDYKDYANSKWEKNFKLLLNFIYSEFKYFKIGLILKYINNSSNYENFDYKLFQTSFYISFSY